MKELLRTVTQIDVITFFSFLTVFCVFIYFFAVVYLTISQKRNLKKYFGEYPNKPKK